MIFPIAITPIEPPSTIVAEVWSTRQSEVPSFGAVSDIFRPATASRCLDKAGTISSQLSSQFALIQEVIQACKNELLSYRDFSLGWDGYRGRPFSDAIIQSALSLTEFIDQFCVGVGLSPREVTPGPASDGTLDVEVGYGTRTLLFTFDPDTNVVGISRRDEQESFEELRVLDRETVEAQLRWLAG